MAPHGKFFLRLQGLKALSLPTSTMAAVGLFCTKVPEAAYGELGVLGWIEDSSAAEDGLRPSFLTDGSSCPRSCRRKSGLNWSSEAVIWETLGERIVPCFMPRV